MKLSIFTVPGTQAELLASSIHKRLEVPHVPIQYSILHEVPTEKPDYLVTVVDSPENTVGRKIARDSGVTLDSALQEYIYIYEYLINNADLVVLKELMSQDLEKTLRKIYDDIRIDTANYLAKTGRVFEEDLAVVPDLSLIFVEDELTPVKFSDDELKSKKFIKAKELYEELKTKPNSF
jgi:hypothetical protein